MSKFTEEDFNSGDGFQTSVWGPITWTSLHIISFNYPVAPSEDDRETNTNWLVGVGSRLPCGARRKNFRTML